MTDELQRNVGGIASHMAVHLPNPCDRDHCRQDAMPRESHSLKPLCTTSVTALLFRTQEKPLQSQRRKVVGFIEDAVRQYSDHEFRRHFRLARPVAEKLVVEFAVTSMCPSSTHGGVQAKSAETHVLTFIWYASNKTCMRDVASHFDMSESTVYRVLQRVAQFLMTLGPSVIKFPADLENLTSSFENVCFEFIYREVFRNVVLERCVTVRECQKLHLLATLPRHEIVLGSTRAGVLRRNLCGQPDLSGGDAAQYLCIDELI
ncbi:hypothetical protein MRX96_016986 [Rhipicephalus microplus]